MRRVTFAAVDASPDHVDSVRRFGNKIYHGDATHLDLLRAAKTEQAKLFVVCTDDVDASLATVKLVPKHFPAVTVPARARNRTHLLKLREIGVDSPIREAFAGSVELSKLVLEGLGETSEQIEKTLTTFVEHDLAMLERQQAVFQHEAKLIALSKTARAELSSILREDAKADCRSDQLAPEMQTHIEAART